ncbi:hypothetical protein BGZ65_003292 [Modicella reniformis]|uniref:Galactose oxidase n=1 Tax=Modicella reniformis TaxID=1440133 RepID=A0A9P6MBJ4_9FUNG|nr:hypothetical protein BGZ65_003292 [Modicella reniformis]
MHWFSLFNGTGYVYNIQSKTWSLVPTNGSLSPELGLSASTDPDSGTIYIPNGYRSNNGTRRLLTVDLANGTTSNVPMHPSLNTSSQFPAAWSSRLDSLLVFANGLYGYNPSGGWSDLDVTVRGDIPTPRTRSCLVSAHDGSKLVLFGGEDISTKQSLNDIHILDVETLTWTKGPVVDPENGRAASACAVSNNHFIVWGGINSIASSPSFPRNTTLVFDLTTAAWTLDYVPVLSSMETFVKETPDNENNHLAIVVGCSVVGAVVLLGILGFILCRMHAKRRAARSVGDTLAKEEEQTHSVFPNTTRTTAVLGSCNNRLVPHDVSDVKADVCYNQCALPTYESVTDMPISTTYLQELTSYSPAPTFEELHGNVRPTALISRKLGPGTTEDAQENESGVIFYSVRMHTIDPVNTTDPMATYQLPDSLYDAQNPSPQPFPSDSTSIAGSSSSLSHVQ